MPLGKHEHECPDCGRIWECEEGGWHAIDYRWFVRCEDDQRKADEEAAAAKEAKEASAPSA